MIAADSLWLTLDKVRVLHGSTTLLEDGYGAFHSRSTVLGGSAVHEAAAILLEKSGPRPPPASTAHWRRAN
jgi:carbon-monoxide dehydrogenase large subunit